MLRIPPVQRALAVTATPASAVLQPGAATSIAVEVNDARGEPVEGANVLLIAVDEAVLAVAGYELLDPIEVFYGPRSVRPTVSRIVRGTILLESPERLQEQIGGATGEYESRWCLTRNPPRRKRWIGR